VTSKGDGHAKLHRTDGCQLIAAKHDGALVLEVLMPGGTRLGDATFGDCVDVSGWYMVEAKKARAAGDDGRADALEANAKIVAARGHLLLDRLILLVASGPDGHPSH
jgi:hypothetical protein